MSNHTFPDKKVTTRKPHDCAWCGEIVEKATTAYAGATLDDGKIFPTWLHPECKAALDESDLYDSFAFGSMERGVALDERSSIG